MAILRSRSASELVHTLENPVVNQAIAVQEQRLAQALAQGKAEGERVAQVKVVAAEAKAAAAEAKAKTAEARAAETDAKLKAQYEQSLGASISLLADATARLEILEKQLVQEAEADVMRLAMQVAARILRREVTADPVWIQPVVQDALALVPDKRAVAVRVHPDEAALLNARKREILADSPGVENLQITADPDLDRGACLLVSQGTRLDASVPTTWERLFRRLNEATPAIPLVVGAGTATEATP